MIDLKKLEHVENFITAVGNTKEVEGIPVKFIVIVGNFTPSVLIARLVSMNESVKVINNKTIEINNDINVLLENNNTYKIYGARVGNIRPDTAIVDSSGVEDLDKWRELLYSGVAQVLAPAKPRLLQTVFTHDKNLK